MCALICATFIITIKLILDYNTSLVHPHLYATLQVYLTLTKRLLSTFFEKYTLVYNNVDRLKRLNTNKQYSDNKYFGKFHKQWPNSADLTHVE